MQQRTDLVIFSYGRQSDPALKPPLTVQEPIPAMPKTAMAIPGYVLQREKVLTHSVPAHALHAIPVEGPLGMRS